MINLFYVTLRIVGMQIFFLNHCIPHAWWLLHYPLLILYVIVQRWYLSASTPTHLKPYQEHNLFTMQQRQKLHLLAYITIHISLIFNLDVIKDHITTDLKERTSWVFLLLFFSQYMCIHISMAWFVVTYVFSFYIGLSWIFNIHIQSFKWKVNHE